MTAPLISIIIPTYNRSHYVQLTIDSALAQTYPNTEVIVVDDGSTDNTEAALQRYGERIRYIKQENQGESVARNVAIEVSQGECVALLDSDDLWQPDKLEKQSALLQNQPEVGLVSCHVGIVNACGDVVSAGPVHPEQQSDKVSLEALVLNSPVHASTILVRKECLDELGGFDTTIRYGEDWDFCLRMASKYQVGFITGPSLAMLRTHGEAQSRYIISQLEAQRRFTDWQRVIQRNFEVYEQEGQSLDALRRAALAQIQARIALLDYVHKNYESGIARLRQLLQLDPERWSDGTEMAELVFRHGLALAKQDPGDAPLDFVRAFFEHLPPEVMQWRRDYRRKILGRLAIESAFLYYDTLQYSLVSNTVLTGLYNDLKVIRNLGVLSIFFRSYVRHIRSR